MAPAFQFKVLGTADQWTAKNPVLALGEIGIETDTGLFKVGTGALWNDTAYSTTIVGSTGATGFAGPTGETGSAGAGGATGSTGSQGTIGVTGATGLSVVGITGTNGVTGATGTGGTTGATGSVGSTGATGVNGVTGATGVNGVTGATGVNGVTGATGVNGVTGATGINGVTGATGSAGTTGATGSVGTTGATGSAGSTGETGSRGTTGATGSNGVTGATATINALTTQVLFNVSGGITGSTNFTYVNPTLTVSSNLVVGIPVSGATGLAVGTSTFIQQVGESINSTAVSATPTTFDWTTGAISYISTANQNWTANITNVPIVPTRRAYTYTFIIEQGGTPRYCSALNINGSAVPINWANNTVPTPAASKKEVETFTILNLSTNPLSASWTVLGDYSTYG